MVKKYRPKSKKQFKGQSFVTRGELPTNSLYFIGNANMFSYEDKLKLLKNKDCVTRPQSVTAAYYDRVKHLDDCTRMQYLDINLWMVGEILIKSGPYEHGKLIGTACTIFR